MLATFRHPAHQMDLELEKRIAFSIDRYGAETGIFQENYDNTMANDDLGPDSI